MTIELDRTPHADFHIGVIWGVEKSDALNMKCFRGGDEVSYLLNGSQKSLLFSNSPPEVCSSLEAVSSLAPGEISSLTEVSGSRRRFLLADGSAAMMPRV